MTPPFTATPPTLAPPPVRWREALAAFKPLSYTQRRFRAQLRLPTDRPIIMSGHQAQFWHPGILAKLLAMDAAARAAGGAGAATAWLIPDQDTIEPPLIRFPARDATGALVLAEWPAHERSTASDHAGEHDIIAAALPALSPVPPAPREQPAIPPVADGLARIRESLARHGGAPSLARQLTASAMDLASPFITPARTIFVSDLCKTDLFRSIVDRALAEPAACTRTYNDAVARTPHAHLRPLAESGPAGPELPFWRLEPSGARRPGFAGQFAGVPPEQLAPRALLVTGLMRLAGCELFIHGTGGAEYDRASEAWLRAWLLDQNALTAGPTSTGPAPITADTFALSTLATATLLLPLGIDPITPEDIARARWRSHHARHNPADLGDAAAQSAKERQLAALRSLPRQSHDRADVFKSMHESLDSARRAHPDRLADIDAGVADIIARSDQGRIAADRTWPFPLYPEAMLLELKRQIDAAFT